MRALTAFKQLVRRACHAACRASAIGNSASAGTREQLRLRWYGLDASAEWVGRLMVNSARGVSWTRFLETKPESSQQLVNRLLPLLLPLVRLSAPPRRARARRRAAHTAAS